MTRVDDLAAAGHFSAENMEPDQRWVATPIAPISSEDEAWFLSQVELARSLAADDEMSNSPVAPAGAPIVFLDIDDVLCLYDPYGGADALECIQAKRIDVELVFRHLMHAPAVAVLREAHQQMGGQLRYVISSTWRQVFTRAQLRHVFGQVGLGFVADKMESRERWATPNCSAPDRYREVAGWLAEHHAGEPYVVVDDMFSGQSLAGALAHPARVILCDEGKGLETKHICNLLSALRTPPRPDERW